MWWKWRLKPEIALQLAFGGLAAPHRFRDQLVGQDQPRFGDVFHRKPQIDFLAGCDLVAMEPYATALDAADNSAEAVAALMGDRHLDLDEMAIVALEIGPAHQRAVDARRGDFQSVGAVDRVGDVE